MKGKEFMKKRIVAMFLVTAMICGSFTACGSNNESSNNTENDDVIIEAGDSTTESESETEESKLDPNKEYVVSHYIHKNSGMIDREQEYTYDEFGNLSKEVYYLDGKVWWTKTFEYNEHGDVIKETTDKSNSDYDDYDYYLYEYDDNGNMIWKQRQEDYKNKVIQTDIWKYDSNNNMIEHYAEDAFEWNGKEIYTYDDNGNVIEEVVYDYQGYLYTTTYKYENNILTKHVVNYSNGDWVEYTYNYNEKEQLVSVIRTSNKMGENDIYGHTGKTEYEYHENGVLAKVLEYSYLEALNGFTEYDEAGNKIYWKDGANEEIFEYIEKPGQN